MHLIVSPGKLWNCKFITVFTTAYQWSLSWTSWIQSTTSLTHLHLSDFLPSCFPTKSLYPFLFYPTHDTFLSSITLLYSIVLLLSPKTNHYQQLPILNTLSLPLMLPGKFPTHKKTASRFSFSYISTFSHHASSIQDRLTASPQGTLFIYSVNKYI
jgi:hypothetical protein